MMKYFKQTSFISILILLILFSANIQAEHQRLIMGRSTEAFPETMSALQEEIKNAGYTISIVQRVDVGLTGMGFQTDKYRVVFFGKVDEIKSIPKKYPTLTPFLPLAIAIFAEEDETILTAMSPEFIEPVYVKKSDANAAELHAIFQRWQRDIKTIIEKVSDVE